MISHFQDEMAEGSNKLGAFASAVSRLGNFSEERVPSEIKSVQPSTELSGAEGLLTHSQSKGKIKPKQEDLDRAHAQQEDLQLKMKILMQSPQLWMQFKARLSSADHGMGTVGVQKVLHEFLKDHPEIEEQLARDQHEAAMRNSKSGFRRMSILETVTNLTSDLAGEAAVRNNNTSIRNSLGSSVASSSFRLEHETRRSSSLGNNDESATSFIGNASEIGMNFLKRASLAATNSLGGSQRSLSDEEASMSSMVSPGSTRSTLSSEHFGKLKDTPSAGLLVPFNENDEDGYVSTDDEDGYLSTDGDDDDEEELEDGFVNLGLSKSAAARAKAA